MNVPSTNYKRILLKLSGEALMGKREFGIDDSILRMVAKQVKGVMETGVAGSHCGGGRQHLEGG